MAIGTKGELGASEGGDEEEKGRVGEMKISYEAANSFKLVGRIEKGGGGALMWIQRGGGFENSGGGSPDGDESIRGSSFFGEASWNFIMFRMHGVIPKILCFDGAKGAEAYVESDKGVGKFG